MTDTHIPEDVMKRARRIANIPALDSLTYILLADDIARAILADREAQAKRVEELEMALRDARCPRPCNGRHDEFTVGECTDALECGCCVGNPLLTAEMLSLLRAKEARAEE